MDGISFQKVELPDGTTYTVTRSGIGSPDKEFVVNQTSYKGNVFQMYGTYDECMDFVMDLFTNFKMPVVESGMAAAVKELADENFHRELG